MKWLRRLSIGGALLLYTTAPASACLPWEDMQEQGWSFIISQSCIQTRSCRVTTAVPLLSQAKAFQWRWSEARLTIRETAGTSVYHVPTGSCRSWNQIQPAAYSTCTCMTGLSLLRIDECNLEEVIGSGKYLPARWMTLVTGHAVTTLWHVKQCASRRTPQYSVETGRIMVTGLIDSRINNKYQVNRTQSLQHRDEPLDRHKTWTNL